MFVSDHIRPISVDAPLDAGSFGLRAARLSRLASAGVSVAPSLVLSFDLIAAVASGGAGVVREAAAMVDAHFPKDAPLGMRRSGQDPKWGGPARIAGIGLTAGSAAEDAYLIDFISQFAARVHGLEADVFAAGSGGAPALAAALVAFEAHSGEPFPTVRADQIEALLKAFARSWASPSARILREAQGAPGDAGLAVIFQQLGAADARRFVQAVDATTGMARRVAGGDISGIVEHGARVLCDAASVELGSLAGTTVAYDLSPARRSRRAEIQIVVDLAERGILTREEAILRIEPRSLSEHLHPQIAADAARDVLGRGIAASPGAALGPLVFSADAAQAADAQGKRAILVRHETSPEDIRGMNSAAGVLTLTGGLTSHAAVIAQGLGVPCVVGVSALEIDADARVLIASDGRRLGEGDLVTLDGSAGTLLAGALPLEHSALSEAFRTLMDWSDAIRRIGVRANADTLQETRTARRFRADGIGLCRTEHMFYDQDRITVMREMILADDARSRAAALARLLPMQRGDFESLFQIMEGAPVTIRLLDPPLHEFLPQSRAGVAELAHSMGLSEATVAARIAALQEFNPMLGKRGVRLAVTFPEIYEMQARAIFEAAGAVAARTGNTVMPEIMIPLVSAAREVELVRDLVERVAKAVAAETGTLPVYKLGVMVETPRAALRAGDLAERSQFLSFGTNDLTQMTYGLSRDDAGRFMRDYVNSGVYPEDPFLTLDVEGVGELLLTAARRGREAKPAIQLGLCGEHGGDPASVRFCRLAGFDYVSCSPYRVPIARLAAAQAELLSLTPANTPGAEG